MCASKDRVSRKTRVEIRWQGDADTEIALFKAIGWPVKDAAAGMVERWTSVPYDLADAARKAVTEAGGILLE